MFCDLKRGNRLLGQNAGGFRGVGVGWLIENSRSLARAPMQKEGWLAE